MSKSSKSCGYTGHMHVVDRVNQTKFDYQAQQAKNVDEHQQGAQNHSKRTSAYQEVAAAQARAQEKCSCKK